MIRNEEAERLAKEKELWNKENRLSKEEKVASWIRTIKALEKIYKGFYSYKDFRMGKFKPEPVWACKESYKDEDKKDSKNEVIKILKLCKKEDVLINSPAVASLICVNRLRTRKATKKDDVMEDTLPIEKLPQAKEIKEERVDINETVSIGSEEKEGGDINKEWSERAIERWGKFLRNFEDKEYVDCYRGRFSISSTNLFDKKHKMFYCMLM
jgi:hypothetical protein